jgi:Asp-tRNA(Asn)/Glu-tRNA(Gln) amidotransferase A subunit family amidase
MNEIVLAPAVRQLELLRSGEISVSELAEAHICQIERLDPELNVFADFDAGRVRVEARRLEELKKPRGAARSAACCTRARFRPRTRWWWGGFGPRVR